MPGSQPTADSASVQFEALFQRLYPDLFHLTYRLLGQRTAVEDVLQSAFLRLSGAAILDRPMPEIAAWTRRVCLNLAANWLRDERRAQGRVEQAGRLELNTESEEDSFSPSSTLLRREVQAHVRATLAQLPRRQSDCLVLRHSGFSYAEIAATLGIAPGSVGVLLARGEHTFRALYQEVDHP